MKKLFKNVANTAILVKDTATGAVGKLTNKKKTKKENRAKLMELQRELARLQSFTHEYESELTTDGFRRMKDRMYEISKEIAELVEI